MTDQQFGDLTQLSENLFVCADTCNVFVVREGHHALLIDSGGGGVIPKLQEIGVQSVDWILHTHFHRDQCWGSPLVTAEYGAKVAVPEHERYLFEAAREHWATRRIFANLNHRNLFLAPAEAIPVDEVLRDYAMFNWRNHQFQVVPADGHTFGSIALIATVDGRRVAFTGDLISSGGYIHEAQALETGGDIPGGVRSSLMSLRTLKRESLGAILSSHGQPAAVSVEDVDLLDKRLVALQEALDLMADWNRVSAPEPSPAGGEELFAISERLLWSGPWACANFYVLLSGSGEALLVDYGLGHWSELHGDRDQVQFESVRFIEHRLDELRERFGVIDIEVVCPTHAHFDHVCGIPFLQQQYGAECWALTEVAECIGEPRRFARNLATYREPIETQKWIESGQKVQWRDIELTFLHAPGHASAHSLISCEVDGRVVVFSGDAYSESSAGVDASRASRLIAPDVIMRDGFRLGMLRHSLRALRTISPDLLCPGHGELIDCNERRLDELEATIAAVENAFAGVVRKPFDRQLDNSWAALRPYLTSARAGERVILELELRNNIDKLAKFESKLCLPRGWVGEPNQLHSIDLGPGEVGEVELSVMVPAVDEHVPGTERHLVTAEVIIDGESVGPIAEALIDVDSNRSTCVEVR